jgi:hypothetical protein
MRGRAATNGLGRHALLPRSTRIDFATQLRSWADEGSLILEYSGGKDVAAKVEDVRDRYP